MLHIIPLLWIFAISLAGTLILTPFAERLAFRFGVLDTPDARKVHTRPIPRWGGIAIAAGVFLGILSFVFVFTDFHRQIDARMAKNLTGLCLAGLLMLILGMLDDKYCLPAKVKLAGQIIIAVILIKFGVAITFLTIPFVGFIYLPSWLSWIVSLLWIVGITNAINLLDGLDGLLAGVSTIFALIFFAVSLFTGQTITALIMIAIAGASMGFLRYNFNPARIFMGDSGSLFLGLMFASLSTMGALKSTTTVAIFVPVLIMALPIFDTAWAIIRRFLSGKPIFSPDKGHLHHQLLARGLSVKEAVLYIYIMCSTLGALGLSLAFIVR